MIKQLLALIVFSLAIIVSMSYAQHAMHFLMLAHSWVSEMLRDVFSGAPAGNLIRDLLALLSIPFFLSLIPAMLYWVIKRSWFPYFMSTMWIVWLVQAGALIIYKG